MSSVIESIDAAFYIVMHSIFQKLDGEGLTPNPET
jgi:hypothetical protein